MSKQNIILVLRPGSLDDVGVQKTGIMLPALLGVSEYFVLFIVLKVQFFRNDFPLVLGVGVLSKIIG